MRRTLWCLTLAGFLLLGSSSVTAESKPTVQGEILGLEFCPQSVCGVALFGGFFVGQVGNNRHAVGTFAVAVNHEPLPPPGESVDLTGGLWELKAGGRRVRGGVGDGTLFNNGDNTFLVIATLQLTQGGSGELSFVGVLDHNVFPPTIKGSLLQ